MAAFDIVQENGVHYVILNPAHEKYPLWTGQLWHDRLPTKEEIAYLCIEGQLLTTLLNDNSKLGIVYGPYANAICDGIITETYAMEAKIPMKPAFAYTPANLFNDSAITSEQFLKRITGSLTRAQAKRINQLGLPGKDFGAPQVASVYTNPSQQLLWLTTYPMAIALLGDQHLFNTIDRRSCKLDIPTLSGSRRIPFVHIDADPDQLVDPEYEEAPVSSIGGVFSLCYLPSHAPGFAYVPDSQKRDFWQKRRRDYPYLFLGKGRKRRVIVSLSTKHDDPMQFMTMTEDGGSLRHIGTMEKGTWFVYKENLLHSLVGARPDAPFLRIAHRQYLGFSRQSNPVIPGYKTKTDFIADRRRAVTTGRSMRCYPSGEQTHAFQPKKYDNFGRIVQSLHDRTGYPITTRTLANGKLIPELVDLHDDPAIFNYTPGPLLESPTIQRLLFGSC